MEQQNIDREQIKGAATSKLMTSKQAARYLCISERKLWDLKKTQRIPAVRIDRTVRFDRGDLDTFIEQQKSFRKL